MASIKTTSENSFTSLLQKVEQLEISDLEKFVENVLKIRARKIAPSLSKKESALLKKINKPLPKKTQARFEVLNNKRQLETLTKLEQVKLIEITKKFEALNVTRLKALADLSKIRQLPVRDLMKQLGIIPKAV